MAQAKSKLEELATWNYSRRFGNMNAWLNDDEGGVRKVPEYVIQSIISDASSGKFCTVKAVAAKNRVTDATAAKYLRMHNVKLKKPLG